MEEVKEPLVYIDGSYYPKSQAKVSVYDHCFLYGDGVFEGIRAYDGRVFKLDEHIDRLYSSAKAIKLEIPMSKEELKKVIIDTLRVNELKDAYVRVVITRGIGDLGLDVRKCPKASIIVIVEPWGPYYGDLYERGLKVITASIRRHSPRCLNPNIKACNYLNNILAKIEANLAGADEAIMLTMEGYVSEGTGDNVFVVKNGELITPPAVYILRGITRQAIIELANEMGIPVKEQDITPYDLYNADEVFLTGTAAEVAPVVEVDGRIIGDGKPGPMTKKLSEKFKELTRTTGAPIY